MTTPLLEVRRLSKTFPGLRALDDVSLTVGAHEVVALVGHNGSGKSTLVKILAGVHAPDPGSEVIVHDAGGTAAGEHAQRERLHFIHQDLGLIPRLSTIENLDLNRSLGRSALAPVRGRREARHAERLLERFGARFDVHAPIARLTAAERTLVAIARALDGWSGPRNVLILDEPTAALHGDEAGRLFDAVRRLAADGAGIVFVSHRLDEVVELADRAVVLRDGRVAADVARGAFDHDALVRLIAGRELEPADVPASRRAGEPILSARGLAGPTLAGVDLDLHAGEVVGVTGIVGSGREQVSGMLFGALPRTAGEVHVAARPLTAAAPRAAIARGVAYVPADRRREGAVMRMSARENLTLPRLAPLRRRLGRLDGRAERAEARRWTEEVGVRPAEPERKLELFSGGNQQKVVLAKWLRIRPRVLLLDEPTQGVDVGAKDGIYRLIRGAAADGAAVLVSSSETKELASLCDRVLVLRDGRVVAEVAREQLSEARLVRETLGGREDDGGRQPGYTDGRDR